MHNKTIKIIFFFQDYKTYLDFVLALENRKEPQALQYLFRLLDIQSKGHLNVFDLNFFFRVREQTSSFIVIGLHLAQNWLEQWSVSLSELTLQ